MVRTKSIVYQTRLLFSLCQITLEKIGGDQLKALECNIDNE